MTIENRPEGTPPSHEENLYFEVRCYDCPDYSEEDGTTFDPPQTLANFTKELIYEQALEIAQGHEDKYLQQGEDHHLIISYWDIGAIREALWGKE